MTNIDTFEACRGRLRSVHVQTAQDEAFAKALDRLLMRDADGQVLPEPVRDVHTNETRGVMVVGASGDGKSTLVRRCLSRHPALGQIDRAPARFLGAETPPGATYKSMGKKLLKDTGYPEISGRREADAIWDLLQHRLVQLGITVLWIDEAHDLFARDRNLILRAVKSLMKGDRAVTVVLSGTEELANIVAIDPQVQRRFSSLVRLEPIYPETHACQMEAVLHRYCQISGLRPPAEPDLIDRIMHANSYRFGRSIEMMRNTVEHALFSGASALEVDHFAEVWSMRPEADPDCNIFLAEDWRAEATPDDRAARQEDEAPRAKKHRVQRKKAVRR